VAFHLGRLLALRSLPLRRIDHKPLCGPYPILKRLHLLYIINFDIGFSTEGITSGWNLGVTIERAGDHS